MKDHEWMKVAISCAKEALPEDVPVGAIVLSEAGQLIATAHNCREQKHKPSGHAELIAVDEAAQKTGDWRLEGCILYVTLEPCLMCASAILQSRLAKVVFGAYDLKEGALGSAYNLTRKGLQVVGGILEEECANLLKDFFRGKRLG